MPSIYRQNFSKELEKSTRYQFRDKAKGFINWQGLDDYNWLFLMQHYGLKTRLLDWTEGYLISLFFSLKLGINDRDFNNPCVWMICPEELNFISHKSRRIFRTENSSSNPDKALMKAYYDLDETVLRIDHPIAIASSYTNDRIISQKGCFTLHGIDIVDIRYFYRSAKSNRLVRIEIDHKSRASIKEELDQAGISDSVLFPDLEGLTREINSRSL